MNSVPIYEESLVHKNFCTFEIASLFNVLRHYLWKYGKYTHCVAYILINVWKWTSTCSNVSFSTWFALKTGRTQHWELKYLKRLTMGFQFQYIFYIWFFWCNKYLDIKTIVRYGKDFLGCFFNASLMQTKTLGAIIYKVI